MTMKIEFKTGNSAFAEDQAEPVSKVIRQVAERIALGNKSGNIVNANGNRVGSYKLTKGNK